MECERCSVDSDLRQGDILAAHPNSPNWQSRWQRFFVIISADCDIAQNKTPNGLVCLPIVGLETYLGDVWIPQQIKILMESAEQKFKSLVRRFAGLEVSAHQARDLSQSEFSQVLQEAAINEKDRDSVTKALIAMQVEFHNVTGLESLMERHSEAGLRDRLHKLFEVEANLSGKGRKGKDVVLNALSGLSDPRRADTWPMLEMTFMDPDMREDERHGFVVDLRRISFMDETKVIRDRSNWLTRPESYHRMCRLRGIYKSDLIQKFANLFVRVGLEDERDSETKRRYSKLAERLLEKR